MNMVWISLTRRLHNLPVLLVSFFANEFYLSTVVPLKSGHLLWLSRLLAVSLENACVMTIIIAHLAYVMHRIRIHILMQLLGVFIKWHIEN